MAAAQRADALWALSTPVSRGPLQSDGPWTASSTGCCALWAGCPATQSCRRDCLPFRGFCAGIVWTVAALLPCASWIPNSGSAACVKCQAQPVPAPPGSAPALGPPFAAARPVHLTRKVIRTQRSAAQKLQFSATFFFPSRGTLILRDTSGLFPLRSMSFLPPPHFFPFAGPHLAAARVFPNFRRQLPGEGAHTFPNLFFFA